MRISIAKINAFFLNIFWFEIQLKIQKQNFRNNKFHFKS